MMRKLLEAMTKFAGEPEQKPGEQWKGTDKGTPGKKLVGDSIIKDLSKGVTPKTKEEELAEAFANFNEDDLGVEEKRPHRTGTRADKVGVRGHKEQPRYKTVKDIDEDSLDNEYEGGESDNDYFDRQKPKKLSKRSQQRDNAADARKIGSFSVDGKVVRSNVNGLDHAQVAKELSNKYPGKNIEWKMTSKPFNEGWMNGSDRVNLPDGPMTYWNGTGRLQNEYNELYEKLVPSQGAAETIEGEVLRASSKIVYRHFNDGDLFNQASFDQLEQYIGRVANYDDLAEKAIEFALKAQGNYHPNTGWDSLDAMDYGPTDDDNGWDEEDEYDDEDDTNWEEEDDELEESSNVVARYADDRARGTGFVYNVDATGQITSSGNIRHNKKFSTPEKAMAYLDKCGFTKKGELEEGANVSYTLLVGDPDTYEKKEIEVSALTSSHAREEAEAMGYKVFKVMDSHGDSLDEGMEEFAKSQAKQRAAKRKSIPWPKEVPTDAEQERNRTRDEEENDPHPYADTPDLDEAKWFKTAYGWAGGRNEKTGKMYKHPDQIKADREAKKAAKAQQSKDAMTGMFGGDAEDLTQNLKIKEAGMPSSVIKHKQALASKTPEALYAGFKQVADKQGKSVESLARSAAWRHGYGKGNGQGSAHYWDKIKHLGETVSEADMFKAGQRAIKNIKSATQQRKSEAEKMAIAQAQIDADRENERDRFSQEELYPSDDSHDVDEGWEADLARSNRERMKKERAAAKPMAPIAKAKPNYDRVFHDINSAIGDTFPDGDPMDALMRRYRDSYGDLNIDLLNKACRVNGAKSYHDYVAKVWQQHMQDNPDLVQGGNPWVAEGEVSTRKYEMMLRNGQVKKFVAKDDADAKRIAAGHGAKSVIRMKGNVPGNKIAENDHPQHYVDRYNKDLERKIDKDFDPDYDRTMSDQEFEAKLKQRGKERNKGVAEGWESGPEERTRVERDPDAEYDARRQEKLDAEADKAPKTTTYQCVGRGPNDEPNYKFGPEHNTSEEAVAYRKKLMANPKTPNPRDIGIRTISKVAKGINEDITSTDPLEGAVLSAVQELIQQGHTEVAPEVITNMVVAATSQPFLLKDLVDANNNSPAIQHYVDSINPTKVKFSSDILTVKNEDPAKDKAKAQAGVSSMASRAANRNRLGEGIETPLRDKNDLKAKRAELMKQAEALGISESTARKLLQNKFQQIGLPRKLGTPDSEAAYKQHIERVKKSGADYVNNTPNTIYKKVDEFAAPGMAGPAATTAPITNATKPVVDPAAVAKAAAATSTLKTATGTTVGAPALDKALDSATQGTATSTDVKALAPIMGVVNQAAQDPKLAAQFKNIANQAKLAK